ncbi:2-oxoglutarate dehydrogenase E2 component [Parafrankia sp. EAN1pec]|uniref:2-oxoglutarate dehydrogenase, E2 component, dihydrolipoamide succinyltransferase n=1 Tax=Parafrankia sp. (strain EAN1pec) TaxID=298653 RepID=UPI00015D9EB4|nr:2-oxoglutarate dehydrogenase E2 component [Frankia sp. EAN1pec]
MSVSVTMPRLGESVSEGTVTRWLKKEGERVEADEPLLEVSTDKVDTEIPAPASGVLGSIKVAEDETVEVGVELAVIEDGAAGAGAAAAPAEAPAAAPEPPPAPAAAAPPPPPAPPAPSAPAPAPAAAPPPPPAPATPVPAQAPVAAPDAAADGLGRYVTPLVRKMAAELGVDLGSVTGSGPGGRITKQDIQDAAKSRGSAPAAAPSAPAAPAVPAAPAPAQAPAAPAAARPAPAAAPTASTAPRGRTEKLTRLRSLVARRMVESLQVSAQLTTVVEADVTRIAKLRERAKANFQAREGVKLSFLPFFAVAACEALREHPGINSSIDLEAGTVTYHDSENLGIAVDTDRGLVVPVIHNASDLNLSGMARKIDELAARTRANQVSPDDLGGGTFTLTNTGSRGALFDTPIINQPQVAILGTGSVVKRPAVVTDPELGEVIAIRSKVYLALTYDHRIVDGADAARFLTAIASRLEEGAFEAELGL